MDAPPALRVRRSLTSIIEAFMFENRNIKFDVVALALLAIVAFLGMALVTHRSSDPPVQLVYPFDRLYQQDILEYPVDQATQNACGPWGSLISSAMLDGLGLGAYYVVLSLVALAVLLLFGIEVDSPVLRSIGWCASLIGLTTLATMIVPSISPGTVIGSGGMAGALGAGVLRYYFAHAGGFVLAVSILVGGLLLCTDYVLVHIGLLLGGLTLAGVRSQGLILPMQIRPDDEEDEYDEEYEDAEEGDDGEVAIRVGGRKIKLYDEETGVEHEEADEVEYEDDEEEEYVEDDEEVEADCDEEVADDDADVEEPEIAVKSQAKSEDETGYLRSRNGRRRLTPFKIRRPPEPEDRDTVMSKLDEADMCESNENYQLPSVDLLQSGDSFDYEEQAKEVRRKAKILEKTFKSFGYDVKVVEIETGPVIAQYEIELEAGLRLSKITGLADDVAIALRVPSVRIVAPIPGKNTVGIEVPNEERQLVRLSEVMAESTTKHKKMSIPVFLGKDVSGNPLAFDLAKLPHLLIAGRTGTGKSVCLNAIIASILMTKGPDEVRMLMIDPKMVELSGYKTLPHLMHPVVTDMRKAEAILAWAVDKMEERYAILAQAGVRHVTGYNQLSEEVLMERFDPQSDEERAAIPLHMPFIVIVADEMADLMMTAGKEVEQHIIRLAQKSRAVGIHLILATQKPTVDVITGLIKSNLPARLAFQVASRTDSRVVLDEMGADKLLGNGDMLFLYPGTSTLLRGQGTFLGDDEINAIVDAASQGKQNFVKELVHLKVEKEQEGTDSKQIRKRDDLYEDAIEVVVREGRGSCSLLQRALGIGYGRAARLIDFMAEDGIVGPYAGSQAREVIMTMAEFQSIKDGDNDEDVAVVNAKVVNSSTKPTAPMAADCRIDDQSKPSPTVPTKNAAVNDPADDSQKHTTEKDVDDEDVDDEEYEYVYEDDDGEVDEDDQYEYVYEDEDEDEDDTDPECEDDEYEYEYEEEEVEETV